MERGLDELCSNLTMHYTQAITTISVLLSLGLWIVFLSQSDPEWGAAQWFSRAGAAEPRSVRLLCWVLTYPASHKDKALAVKETWGRRCDILLFMSDVDDENLPAIDVAEQPGRDHLTAKTRKALDYVYERHLDDADWFLKADDDTYVIVENLRHMLASHSSGEAVYFGEHLTDQVAQGFFSGGAGYVLSREALRRYGRRARGSCEADYNEAEDVFVGECLQELGVATGDSRDEYGRQTFHCLRPIDYLLGARHSHWYITLSKYAPQKGLGNMSRYPISFHYVSYQMMYELEYYIYHVKIRDAEEPQNIQRHPIKILN